MLRAPRGRAILRHLRMAQPDSIPTRTAEAQPTPSPASGSGASDPSSPARTELLLNSGMDTDAVSFTHERQRASMRASHSRAVRHLRLALSIGVGVWIGAALLDLFVTQYAGEADLAVLFSNRIAGTLIVLAVVWRLRRQPEPSVHALWALDIVGFTSVAVCVSLNTISYRGLDSPYAAGILMVLLARGAATMAPWRHGALLFAPPALAYPVTLLVASKFDARIAAQLHDPSAIGAFGCMLVMIALSLIVLIWLGHFTWQLARDASQAHNIGRYKLERLLGSGGMGDVWAAFDLTLKQRVALKTVNSQRLSSSGVARLEREVRALAGLTHPNTVRVYDYGSTDDGLWYYVMELLHGQTLRELVERGGPLRAERLLPIARQVLRALGEAHNKGIIHRDIKPENVFIAEIGGETDIVKLIDFGIAKATSSSDVTLTNAGSIIGTPAYMAPELIQGHAADRRTDIYSFGAMLYYATSARLPFSAPDSVTLFAALLSRSPEPLASVVEHPLPPGLVRVIERCMAKDPDERYPSTQALLEALQDSGAS
jgi:eukaryotic-like serine/threonine-protein kinase